MVQAHMRFAIAVLAGLAASPIASAAHAASGLAPIDASVKLQAKGCGKLAGSTSAQLGLADAGTWSLAIEASDALAGTYVAGGKGGRTLTLTLDAGSLAAIQTSLRNEAGTLCGAPADSAVITVKKARAKLDKAGTSASLLVKAALAADGNPFKKGKYTLKGSGPLGPLPTTTTTSTVSTTTTTTTTISSITTTTSSTTSTSTATSSSTTTSIVTSTTSTTTPGSSTTSTTMVPGSTTTTSIASSTTSTTTVGSSTTSTTILTSSTTSTTTAGSSTTSTTTLESSTTTVSTTSTTSTTSITPGGYGDCVNGGPAACTPAETCLSDVFEGDTVGLCTVPCALDEDCPAPGSGNPRVGCNAPACLLFCDGGEACPDGMECLAGMLCYFTGPCTPNCDGRACGDDGCGLTCGDCMSGTVCTAGQCVAGDSCAARCNTFDDLASCQCDPPCVGAGDCCSDICDPGVCAGEDICTCVPDCTERFCGSDGCFGTCGECLTVGDVCSQAGQCIPGNSCVGRCDTFDTEASCQCDVSCIASGDCCADICSPGVCDTAAVCTCTPDCTERECGSDGCGGSCSDCVTVGEVCSEAGQCVSGGSCLGRCGTYDENALCQCDPDCGTFGDCCLDMCAAGVCEGLPPCA